MYTNSGKRDTHNEKGVTVRFGFDAIRISQIPSSLSKTEQQRRPV